MAQVISGGALVKVKATNHHRAGEAGMALGGSVAPANDVVAVRFDLDSQVEEVNTDDLQVLG